MLFGDFFKDSIAVLAERHPAMEELAKAFHGPAAMAAHSLTGPIFWLALAGVWTDKGSKIFKVTSQIRAGVIWANTYNKFDPTSPFVHAALALKEDGFETIMVNSNPETVSTDYDTSDKLYFEPLTLEDVLNIYDQEQPEGVFVQFGGQTPLNLASGLKAAGVPILGTQTESIETAEDRKLFAAMLDKLGLRQTPNGSATSAKEAVAIAKKIGYPVLVRPSFVLGGRAMELVYTETDLRRYMTSAIEVTPDRPVLIDRFLEDAIEVDVDCISDGETAVIGAIMEHIEEAGIHSGDSTTVIPPYIIGLREQDRVRPERDREVELSFRDHEILHEDRQARDAARLHRAQARAQRR